MFTQLDYQILELARKVWEERPEVSTLISKPQNPAMGAEQWFTIELMLRLERAGFNVKKTQGKKGNKLREGDINVDGRKVEIRAISSSVYRWIVDGWKAGIDVLVWGGVFNKRAEGKLQSLPIFENRIIRINENVAVGLLRKKEEQEKPLGSAS
jgi:hypothetical protein